MKNHDLKLHFEHKCNMIMQLKNPLTSSTSCWALGAYDGPCIIVLDVIPFLITFLQSVFPTYTWVPALQQYLQEKECGKNDEMKDNKKHHYVDLSNQGK